MEYNFLSQVQEYENYLRIILFLRYLSKFFIKFFSSDYKSAYKKEFGTIKANLIKLKSNLFNQTSQSTTIVQMY